MSKEKLLLSFRSPLLQDGEEYWFVAKLMQDVRKIFLIASWAEPETARPGKTCKTV